MNGLASGGRRLALAAALLAAPAAAAEDFADLPLRIDCPEDAVIDAPNEPFTPGVFDGVRLSFGLALADVLLFLADAIDDPAETADIQDMVANELLYRREFVLAEERFRLALDAWRAANNRVKAERARIGIANAMRGQGRTTEAWAEARNILRRAAPRNHPYFVAAPIGTLTRIAEGCGEAELASELRASLFRWLASRGAPLPGPDGMGEPKARNPEAASPE